MICHEYLDHHGFASLKEAPQPIEASRTGYHTQRPHRALNQQTPSAIVAAWTHPQRSSD